MRRRYRLGSVALGAAGLAEGCALIDYAPQARAFDAAGTGPVDDGGLEGGLDGAPDPPTDASREDAHPEDAAAEDAGERDGATTCVRRSPGGSVRIDDLEDGDAYPLAHYGLNGEWYLVSDGTAGSLSPPSDAVPVPVDTGALGSARSMHFTASGFTRWGAGMLVSLNEGGCGYDASLQTGVELSLKGSGNVLVSVATKQTAPIASGGSCTTGCNDAFSVTLPVSSSWAQRKVAFASLAQAGWGTPTSFDATQLLYVQFTVLPNSSLDLYIDNVGFY